MAYQRPMVTVDQNMTTTPTSIERDQPAFIFGPNYQLHRYTNADERSDTYVGKYEGEAVAFEYPKVIDADKVDRDYVKVFGENVGVKLVDLTASDNEYFATLVEKDMPTALRLVRGGYTRLFFKGRQFVKKGKSDGLFNGLQASLAVGDRLAVTYTDTSSEPSVTQTIYTTVADVLYFGEGEGKDYDASYIGGDVDDDVTGVGTLVTIADPIPEGVLNISNADEDSSADTAKVKVSLIAILPSVEFGRKDLVSTKEGVYQWSTSEKGKTIIDPKDGVRKLKGVHVGKDLYATVSGYWEDDKECKVLFADLYVQYRELVTSYADTLHSLTGASSVSAQLGTVDPDNPLAQGVYMAALNSATDDGGEAPAVYFMAVPSDDADGYSAVLDKATLTDAPYVFAPTTRDDAVIELVKSHVVSMSTKVEKMWRIAAVSSEVPNETAVLTGTMNTDGSAFLAVPITANGKYVADKDDVYKYLRIVKSKTDKSGNTDVRLRSDVREGDIVRFGYKENGWKETVYSTFVVKGAVNNFMVEIAPDDNGDYIDADALVKLGALTETKDSDGKTSGYEAAAVEIYHPYTNAEKATRIASTSRALASRRMLNVFPSVFTNNGVTLTGEFAACAVAGLVSATEPQQPITNVALNGIDDIPLTYTTFNKTQLDKIASGGTFIVAQDLPGDQVYVRHQITTAYPDGNLNTAELSITKNVDSISYAFAEVFRPYYGKYNITPDLLSILENIAGQLISQLGASTSVYGPQLIMEGTEIKYVRQNELMKDHVDIAVTLNVPYPCNNIDIVLTV